jgi:WS/DGAT/MGAT family acyltransferase
MTAQRFPGRMSEAEALLWRLDADPALSGTFGNITMLDRAPDWERFRRRLQYAASVIPRLRQRVHQGPTPLVPPSWVDDPDFDPDFHVRRVALPRPGSPAQLLELVANTLLDPFDRTRPLWQVTVVEGLRGGRAAVIEKLHHSVADGEVGMRFALEIMDLERDAPGPTIDSDHQEAGTPAPPTDAPSDPDRSGVDAPTSLPAFADLVADAAGSIRSAVAQLTDLESARSTLWTARSLRRRIEIVSVPLERVLGPARRLGGTLNTAMLTAVADAAGAYHRDLDHPVEALRATMAVSTRTDSSGTNAFTLARLTVPTDRMPIARRFALVHAEATRVRAIAESAPLERLAVVAGVLPTAVVTRIARQQSRTVDFGISTLRGAPVPVYIAGAKVTANHPIGPLVGTALNATAMSSDTSIDIGLHIDGAAIVEPDRLRRRLVEAFRRLERGAGAAE